MANKQLNYDIKFNTDMTSLEELKEALMNIKSMSAGQYIKLNGVEATKAELLRVQGTAAQVGLAIEECFNPKLNTFNFTQFNQILKATGLNAQKIEADFDTLGEQGKRAFRNLTESLYTTNATLDKSKTLLNSIGDTLINAAKWSVAYGVINNISNGIKSAWTYAVSLDSALNDIRIVTGKSYQDMEKFAKSANKAAKALGTSTMDYTKGSLIYYQQGLGEKEVAARTAVSAKTANVTGQSMQEVSEELTAVWNGFKVTADETESYVDKLAAVAAASASDLEELSTAMSRVASAASTMGINVDQLTAQIATIESVTRQDAASIGTALKTIYSRMGDLAIGAEDEFGVALGDVSSKMKQMGIDILNQQGNMRDMGDIIEEVAAKWKTWTNAQQQAAAVALAGKRQYNNLFALFENWDMYEANKVVSENSLGELQKQQDIYMESTQAHLEQLGASVERIKNAFFENKSMNNFIDALSTIANWFGGFVETIGGGGNLLLGVFGSLATIFSKDIGRNMSDFIEKINLTNKNLTETEAKAKVIAQFGKSADKIVEEMSQIEQQRVKYANYLTDADNERYNALIKQRKQLLEQKEVLDGMKSRTENLIQDDGRLKIKDNDGKEKNIKTSNALSALLQEENGKYGIKEKQSKNGLPVFHKITSFDDLMNLSDKSKELILGNIDKARTEVDSNYSTAINNKNVVDKYNKFNNKKDKNGQTQISRENEKANNAAKQQIQLAVQQYKQGVLDIEQKKKLRESLEGLIDTQENAIDVDLSNENTKKAILNLEQNLTRSYAQSQENIDKVKDAMTSFNAESAVMNENLKQNKKGVEDLGNKGAWAAITDTITTALGVIMQTTAAISSLGSTIHTIVDSIKNASSSGLETIAKVIPALAAAVLTILSLAKTLKTQLIAEAKAASSGITAALSWIGLILAAIAALVSLVDTVLSFVDTRTELEKATDEYKKQVEILNDLQEALTNTKNAYQDLLEEIDNYKSARDGINALKVGTEEWEKAIVAANEQVIDFLNNYDELISYISVDSNGLLSISNEGLNLIKEKQKEAIKNQQNLIFQQQTLVKQSQTKIKEETFYKDAKNIYLDTIKFSNDDLEIIKKASDFKSLLSKGREMYQQQGNAYFLSSEFEDLTKGLSDNEEDLEKLRESLKNTIIATNSNTEAIKVYNQQRAKNMLTGKSGYDSSSNKNAIENVYNSLTEQISDKYNSSTGDKDLYNNNEDFRKYLATALGVPEENLDKKMSWGNLRYTDANGESKTLTKEQMVNYVNTYLKDTEVLNGKTLQTAILTINRNEATGKSYLNEFAGKSKTDSISFGTLKGNDYNKGWTALMGDVDEDYLKAIGYTGTVDDYKEQFQKWYEKSEEERKATIEDFQTEAGIIGDITNTLTNLENQQIKTILSATTKISNTLGHETSQAFFDFVNSDEFTADEKETIAEIASTTDFTSLTGINDFITNLENAGIDIDLNNEKYSAFADSIDQSNNLLVASVNNIKDLKTYLSEINKLVKETKVGDILEKEDYQKLISANPELRDAFVETADGYRLVKSVDLESSVKSELSDLNSFSDFYQGYNSGVAKITSKNIAFDETELNSEKLKNQVNQIKEGATDEFYKVIGLDRADIENAVNADKPSAAQISLMQNFISKTKKAVAQGAFSDRQIKELYATFMTTNLDDIEQLRKSHQIDEDTYQKARTDKLLDYINALDISIDTYKEFAELVGNDKKALEALYRVQAIDAEIEEIQKRSKNLKGESLAASLEDQNKLLELQRDILAIEEEAGKKALGLSNNLNYYEVYEAYTKAKAKSGRLKDEEEKIWQDLLKSMSGQEDISSTMKENVFSTITTKLDVVLDENQIKAEWADFKKNYMKTDKNGNIVFKSVIEMNQDVDFASRLAAIQTKTDLFKESFAKTSETIRELETKNTDEAKIKIQALREEQKSQIEEQINNLNDLYTLWTDGWDEVLSLSDEYAEKLEQINSLYSKFISLNNTLNKVLGNNNDFYQAEINNQNEIISARRQSLDNAINEYQQAQANNDTKLMESTKEKIESYSNSLLESSLALLDLIKEKAKADIEEIFENLNKASEDWDRTKTLDDRLLNIADSNLNRNQFKRKYQEAFESADSLAAQKKIREVMEDQLDILEKKDRLSQYEVDRANAVYELTLKQIALEESQRNASKMKLVRDTNGNLTYSFVQDEDAAAKAQEELEQAQNNLFNIDNNEARNQIDKYYQYISEWEQKLQQAREEGWSEEEIAKINNYYTGENGLITNIQKGLNGILANLTSSSEENGILANTLEAYKKAKEIYETDANEILTKINKNQVDYVTNWNNAATTVSNAVTKVQELINTILTPENKNSLDEKIQDLINLLDPKVEGSIGKALTGTNFNLSKVVNDETSPFKLFSKDIASFVSAMENYKIEIGEYASQIKNLIGKETPEKRPGGSNFQYPNQSYYMYDTGGYTGEWGSEGKLAILHQKELVLNANDTANMLAAVQVVRTLDETLGDIGLALAAQSAIPAIKPSLGKISNQNDIVDQNVRIEANFPNVTDKYEIQEAINNLVNLASQKAFDDKY